MKKILTLLLALALVFSFASCDFLGSSSYLGLTEEQYINAKIKSEGVMTYAEYAAAALESDVVIEAYVQDTQSWWNDKITVYLADLDGAYFAYEMACTEEDAAKLVPGTKIKVTGEKGEWAGEVEIMSATFEFVGEENDKYIAPALDVTSLLGKDSLVKYQNQLVKFTKMTVVSVSYKNNTPGDDIYVTLEKDGVEVEFCVEFYLNGSDAEFYDAFAELVEGDLVNVEGYAYWYNGINTHITKITKLQ